MVKTASLLQKLFNQAPKIACLDIAVSVTSHSKIHFHMTASSLEQDIE